MGGLAFDPTRLNELKKYFLRGPPYILIATGLVGAFMLLFTYIDVLLGRLRVDELPRAYESTVVTMLTILLTLAVCYYLTLVGFALYVRRKLNYLAIIFLVFLVLVVLIPWRDVKLFKSIEFIVAVPVLMGFTHALLFFLFAVIDAILARMGRRTLLDFMLKDP